MECEFRSGTLEFCLHVDLTGGSAIHAEDDYHQRKTLDAHDAWGRGGGKGNVSMTAPDMQIHTPTTLIRIFSAAITPRETKRIVRIKGIYEAGRGTKVYHGYGYDRLQDEASTQSLTLKVPSLIRQRLQPGKTYLFEGILERSIRNEGSIQLVFTCSRCLSEEAPGFSEDTLRQLDLQRLKSNAGYRDFDAAIKSKLYQHEPPRLLILYGQAGIVDQDVLTALKNRVTRFDLTPQRVNMLLPQALIEALNSIPADVDAVGIARGGGSGLDVFNDSWLAETVARSTSIVFTAIGHAADVTLVERVADKRFPTPTAFGNHLYELAEEVEATRLRSRTALVEQVRNEFANSIRAYDEQVSHLQRQIGGLE